MMYLTAAWKEKRSRGFGGAGRERNEEIWIELINDLGTRSHPHLYALLAHCDRCHTHTDSEALYILAGEGIFGFVRPDGSQVELIVQPEEYIRVPAGIEHWFSPTASLQLKAVRYFTSVEGWVPQYTNTAICFRQAVARGYSE
jgi:cupin superfamily acireductone dioxygenase involved in methionine salvage